MDPVRAVSDMEYLRRIAQQAARGIAGEGVLRPEVLEATIHDALLAIVDAAYQRGVQSSVVQLSLLPDGAHAL